MSACLKKCANLWCFLVVFCLCYFLETITFTYLISAVQSVERQFQIPSSKSGTLIAASDIGYVLTVVVLAYVGSKGNRARWIGGGCVLISLACFMASLPNFIFPNNEERSFSHDFVVQSLVPKPDNVTVESVLADPYLKTKWLMFQKQKENPERTPVVPKFFQTDLPTTKLITRPPTPAPTSRPTEKLTTPLPTTKLPVTTRPPTTVSSARPIQTLKHIKDTELIETGSGDFTLEDVEEGEDEDDTAAQIMPDQVFRIVKRDAHPVPLVEFLNFVNRSITENDTRLLKVGSNLPFSFCNTAVNKLKKVIADEKCKEKRTNKVAELIVFVAIAFIGVGHSMPWTLGMPLIDDNVKKENTPFFFAGVFFIRIMGPVLGFVLGGWADKLYVTLNPPRGLTPSDPGWIGAWWLGFLVVSSALFIPSVMLCCFPNVDLKNRNRRASIKKSADETDGQANIPMVSQHFPEDKRYYDGNTLPVDEIEHAMVQVEKRTLWGELKNFFVSLGHCLKSPVYSGALIGRLFDAFAFKGFFVFQPKFLQSHYGIPQYRVNYYMAIMGIVGFAAGVVLGSLIMRKGKLEGRRAAFYVGVCSFISAALSFSEIFLGCQSVINQVGQLMTTNFTQPCNQNCGCDIENLFPVCDRNHTPYYNPCYAGCRTPVLISKEKFQFNLTQCGCAGNETVSRNFCQDDCTTPMTIYFALSTFSGIIAGSSVIPGILIVFRSVPHDLRSVALGFSGFIVSLLSTFPSPIVLGSIIDTTCILWEKTCGIKGSCKLYDPKALRIRIHLFHGILRTCALLFDVWVWYWSTNLKLMEEKDEKKEPLAQNDRSSKMPDLKPKQKKSAVMDFVETFGSQYELNFTGVGDNPPSDVGPKLSM